VFGSSWLSWSAIIVAAVSSWALKPLAARWASEPKWALRVKLLSGARQLLLIFVMLAALVEVVLSSSGLAASARWVVGGAAALCVLPCFVNAMAGLWLLSSFVDVSPGDRLLTCGHSGRVLAYGLTRLELLTDANELVYVPYLAVTTRPIVTSRSGATSRTEVRLNRHDWTEDMIQFVRQAAILAPYRALTSPVHVSREEDVVTVQLSLARPGSERQMKRLLEAALARYEVEVGDVGAPKQVEPSKRAVFVQEASTVNRRDHHGK
jgi:hypothetical protein